MNLLRIFRFFFIGLLLLAINACTPPERYKDMDAAQKKAAIEKIITQLKTLEPEKISWLFYRGFLVLDSTNKLIKEIKSFDTFQKHFKTSENLEKEIKSIENELKQRKYAFDKELFQRWLQTQNDKLADKKQELYFSKLIENDDPKATDTIRGNNIKLCQENLERGEKDLKEKFKDVSQIKEYIIKDIENFYNKGYLDSFLDAVLSEVKISEIHSLIEKLPQLAEKFGKLECDSDLEQRMKKIEEEVKNNPSNNNELEEYLKAGQKYSGDLFDKEVLDLIVNIAEGLINSLPNLENIKEQLPELLNKIKQQSFTIKLFTTTEEKEN